MNSFFRASVLMLALPPVCTVVRAGINEDLIAAVKSGPAPAVSRLLAAGADVNGSDDSGVTPLDYAAAAGQRDLLELLISKGADVNAKSSEGVSPLYLAAKFGHTDAAESLISHGAAVNARTKSGYTPLSIASSNGDFTVAKLLVDHDADDNATDVNGVSPLLWACKAMYSGWIVNSPSPTALELQKAMGGAALQQLRDALSHARGQWREVAMLLVEHGADVNTAVGGDAPLGLAATIGDKDLVEALLEKGANVNGSIQGSETPLHAAIAEKHRDVAELLVNSGADVNAPNRSGRTPLHFVSRFMDDPTLVELMIDHGADVNARDKNGAGALGFAIEAGNNQTAEVLRLHGGK